MWAALTFQPLDQNIDIVLLLNAACMEKEKKKKSLSLLFETSNSNFDSDVGIQINNTRVPRERCHQTEYICVAQTHFDCGNIKRNCFKNLVKKGSFDSVDDVKVKKDECQRCLLSRGPPVGLVKLLYCLCYLAYFLMRMSFSRRNRTEVPLTHSAASDAHF